VPRDVLAQPTVPTGASPGGFRNCPREGRRPERQSEAPRGRVLRPSGEEERPYRDDFVTAIMAMTTAA